MGIQKKQEQTGSYYTYKIQHTHPEETSKNSDNCDFSKVSDIAKALESMEN